MVDFQVGDRVVTNEAARELTRLSYEQEGWLRHGTKYLEPGERAVVLAVDDELGLIYIKFDDGFEDNVYDWALDLEYRPINDPKMYDRTLFD